MVDTGTKGLLFALAGLTLAMLFAAGCFTGDIYTTVTADGEISDYCVELTTTQVVYSLLKDSAEENGYASVREMIEKEGIEGQDIDFDYNERWDKEEDEVTLIFSVTGPFSPDQIEDLTITKTEDGHLVYRQQVGDEEEAEAPEDNPFADTMASAFSMNYYLEMPGDIVDSNANVMDGHTAEWHLSGSDLTGTELYAKSEVPAPAMGGFGVILGVTALFGLLWWRRS